MTAAGRPLRILALPLAHLPGTPASAPPLIYWHVSQRLPASSSSSSSLPAASESSEATASTSSAASTSTVLTRPAMLAGLDYARPTTWPDWATQKASATWLTLSHGPQEGGIVKTWKYKTWRTGERLMDKIACEEWALKNVQTRLDPWTGEVKRGAGSVEVDEKGEEELVLEAPRKLSSEDKIQLLFPPSLAAHSPLSLLRSHLTTRIPYHRTLLRRSLLLVPALLPIGLIPVLPNLPMFYVLWRAWSHWKAAAGGEYLLALIEEGRVAEVQNDEIERVRTVRAAADERAPDETASTEEALKAPASPEVHEKILNAGAQRKLEEDVPSPEKVDEAPDATATPASQIFHAGADAASSSSSSSASTASSNAASKDDDRISAQLLLKPSAIPALARAFDISSPEVVDITRAVEQAAIRWKEQEAKEAGDAKTSQ